MKIRVINSSDKVVFCGTQEEFARFPLNDSDRVEIIRENKL